MGVNDKLYSLGAARQAPEFAAVLKLAGALALTRAADKASNENKCATEAAYVCINGSTNECRVDKCGTCYTNEDGTYCHWATISPPIIARRMVSVADLTRPLDKNPAARTRGGCAVLAGRCGERSLEINLNWF